MRQSRERAKMAPFSSFLHGRKKSKRQEEEEEEHEEEEEEEEEEVKQPKQKKKEASSSSSSSEEEEDEDEEDAEAVAVAKKKRRRGIFSSSMGMTKEVKARMGGVKMPRMAVFKSYNDNPTAGRDVYEDVRAEYNAKREVYDSALVKAMDEEGISRRDRPPFVLRAECKIKGIYCAEGSRTLLIQRLESLDRGEPVMRVELLKRQKIAPESLTRTVIAHTPLAAAYPDARKRLLCLSRDLMAGALLPYVDEASLFNLLFTCKHLFAVVHPAIEQRARAIFAGLDGVTPMALSCALACDEVERCQVKARRTKLQRMLCMRISDTRLRSEFDWQGVLPLELTDVTNYYAVRDAVESYGSIEGLVAHKQKLVERTALRARERELMFEDAPARLAELNDKLGETGFPEMFKALPKAAAAAAKKGTKELPQAKKKGRKGYREKRRDSLGAADCMAPTTACMLLLDMIKEAGSLSYGTTQFLSKANGFVFRHSPVNVETVIGTISHVNANIVSLVSRMSPQLDYYLPSIKKAAAFCCMLFDVTKPLMLNSGDQISKARQDSLLSWICDNQRDEWLSSQALALLDVAQPYTMAAVAIVWEDETRIPYFESNSTGYTMTLRQAIGNVSLQILPEFSTRHVTSTVFGSYMTIDDMLGHPTHWLDQQIRGRELISRYVMVFYVHKNPVETGHVNTWEQMKKTGTF